MSHSTLELIMTASGGYVTPDDPGEIGYSNAPPRTSVSDADGEHLSELAKGLRCLEIGTGLGVSTEYIARTASQVVTVDNDPWVRDRIVPNLPEGVIALFGHARSAAPFAPFDLVFIDGHHEAAAVVDDIAEARAMLKAGGEIVLHDWKLEGVHLAAIGSGLTWEVIDTVAGMAVARV